MTRPAEGALQRKMQRASERPMRLLPHIFSGRKPYIRESGSQMSRLATVSILVAIFVAGLSAFGGGSAARPESAPAATEGLAPRLFAPGVISTEADEVGAAFAPDGRTLSFTRRSPTTSTPTVSVIFFSRLANGRWGTPEVASFSGRYRDPSPAISPGGSR